MKKWFFIFLILGLPFVSISQGTFYAPCKDPLKTENIFYPCYDDYTPVCACDGKTYRSVCAAENQYAINAGNYIDGPCEDFHYVIEPNLISNILNIRMFQKKAGYVSIIIFDVYGHIYYQNVITIPVGRTDREINETASFQHGLYIIEIISGEVRLVRKFFKAKN